MSQYLFSSPMTLKFLHFISVDEYPFSLGCEDLSPFVYTHFHKNHLSLSDHRPVNNRVWTRPSGGQHHDHLSTQLEYYDQNQPNGLKINMQIVLVLAYNLRYNTSRC